MIYFTAHTFKCVCHCRRAMFRVLGMYNFAFSLEFQKSFSITRTIFSHSRSKQFWKQNTISKPILLYALVLLNYVLTSEKKRIQQCAKLNNFGYSFAKLAKIYLFCLWERAKQVAQRQGTRLSNKHLTFEFYCSICQDSKVICLLTHGGLYRDLHDLYG